MELPGKIGIKGVILSSLLSNNCLLIGFPDYREPAQRLARTAGIPYADVLIHHFPDGETRLRLPEQLPECIVLCITLDHPNSRLVELALAAATARDLGVKHITLVAPYLCYMRQDKAFHPGEAVSQRIIGTLIAALLTLLVYLLVSRRLILFGRRRFVFLILVGGVWSILWRMLFPALFPLSVEFTVIGWVIPGLVANHYAKDIDLFGYTFDDFEKEMGPVGSLVAPTTP